MNNHRLVRILIFLLLLPGILGVGFAGGVLADHFLLTPTTASANAPSGQDLYTQAYNIVQQNYVDRAALDQTKLTYGAISGMVDALGDTGHSRFLSPEMVKAENVLTTGQFEGIGAEVTMKDGQVVIVAPIDGSPAQAAGLKPGDIIAKVDGVDMSGMNLSDVVGRVLGPAGTKVTLTVQDPKTGALRDVSIVRARINVVNLTWAMLPGTTIAHVRISTFSQGVTEALKTALQQIHQQGATGIILDLRDNPGGLLDESVGVASQFLGSGNVLLVKNAQGQQQAVAVKPGGSALTTPLVVLVNQGTGSAAEIVAGALQDAQRGKLIGETTFGTGTVLYGFKLSDGSEVLLATEEWLTPNGRVIWHKGIAPDVVVSMDASVIPLVPSAEKSMSAGDLKASPDVQLLKGLSQLLSGG